MASPIASPIASPTGVCATALCGGPKDCMSERFPAGATVAVGAAPSGATSANCSSGATTAARTAGAVRGATWAASRAK